jgi:arylsulfatase
MGSGTFPHTIPFALEASETFDIGSDTGTGVNDADYQTPFAFSGTINSLTIELDPQG